MITLKNISLENIQDSLALKTEAWQEKYTSPVATCIARAYVEPEKLIPLAIVNGDQAVGFLQFRLLAEKAVIILENFMVDYQHQTQGYGTAGLRSFVDYAENFHPYERIYCVVDMGNATARNVLEKAGFMRGTVDLENKKIEMVYIIR